MMVLMWMSLLLSMLMLMKMMISLLFLLISSSYSSKKTHRLEVYFFCGYRNKKIGDEVIGVKRMVVLESKKDLKSGGIRGKLLLYYQSQVSILGPVGYGPTTLPLRHSDLLMSLGYNNYLALFNVFSLAFDTTLVMCKNLSIKMVLHLIEMEIK
jgi:hypothetical protein